MTILELGDTHVSLELSHGWMEIWGERNATSNSVQRDLP